MKSQPKSIELDASDRQVWYGVLTSSGYLSYTSTSKQDAIDIANNNDEIVTLVQID